MKESMTLLNYAQLLKRCLDNPEFVTQMLTIFQESIPHVHQAMKQAIDQGDFDAASRRAHMMKGSAANLAIETLKLRAAELESACDAKDIHTIHQASAKLEVCLSMALIEVQECLDQDAARR